MKNILNISLKQKNIKKLKTVLARTLLGIVQFFLTKIPISPT